MEAMRLNKLLDSFNLQADVVKNRLTDLLVTVSDGRIPNSDVLKRFTADMGTLVSGYNLLRSEAQAVLNVEEMPEEGSKASAYIDAVNNSKSRLIKLQLERAEAILKRFLKVRSHIAEYEAALSPFKEKAADVLNELSEENIDIIVSATKAPELFLEALDIDNINGPEGFRVLGEINKHYPMQIQWGLAGGQYFIDESVEKDTDIAPAEEQKAEEAVARKEDASENEGVAENILTESIDTDNVEIELSNEEEKVIHADAKEQSQKQEAEEIEESALTILNAKNRVKNSSPSASSLKKEIVKIAKNNKEVRSILPLMTNLGILNREQIYIVGICMDVFDESDRDREKVDAAIDALAAKGYIAEFEYEESGTTEDAFCLSSYCYGCLKKDSISVQMRGFWELSFRDVKIVSSGNINKAVAEKFIRNNRRLAEYLYVAKGIFEPDEYQTIKQSIKWKTDHYQITVIKDEEIINCILCDPEDPFDKIEEFGILYVGEEEVDEAIRNSRVKVFVCSNQSIRMYDKSNNSADGETSVDDTLAEEVAATENMDESVGLKDTEQTSDETGIITDDLQVDDESEGISVKFLLKKNVIPTDAEFYSIMEQLLNREAKTKEQLISLIAQLAVFAKAVEDVSLKENGVSVDHQESNRLSAQVRLASNLMLNKCIYTSEFLSSVFVNHENEDPALMLSAYLFAMLVPGMAFDYGLKSQTEIFLDQYEKYFNDFVAFKPLFNKLMSVRDVASTGFSPAFVSLLGDEAESEKFINELRMSARECLTVKTPKTRMKALPPMYSACFGIGSELHDCMSIISENKQDKDDVELVEVILSEYCDEQNGERSLSNVKIEDKLTKAWYDANPKNKFKLEYDARDQALRQFWVRLEIMQAWVEHINNMNNRKQDISRLKTLKSDIIKLIQIIQKDASWKNRKNANILTWALFHMQQYLNGQVVKLKIYSEFLYTGILTVGNDGIPVIDRDLAKVKYYEPWRNVLAHIDSVKKSVTDVKEEILGDKLDDKADEEGLKDNLHQLEMLGKLLEDNDEDYIITEGQLKDAIESADDRATRFREKLELAYTYNQINETEKENLLGIMNQYKLGFYEAKDFACWRRFLEALERQITEFAKGWKIQLRARLDARLKENPESSLLNEANRLLEQEMNFAVTEEYINRFEGGETDLDDDVILHDVDYFSDFLEPRNFDPLLQECRRCNGKSLSVFGWNYVERNLPREWTSRQKEICVA